MASVNGKHGVFTTDVEDLTVDVGGQVVFATVAAVGCVEDGPRGVRGFVGSQVHRDEQAFVLVGLRAPIRWYASNMDGVSSLATVPLPSPKHPASSMDRAMAATRSVLRMTAPRLGVI